MKLVETREGVGQLSHRGTSVGAVPYTIKRFQAMTKGGLPVPGLHRVEGRLVLDGLEPDQMLEAEARLGLELEDGRRLDLVMIDADGNVLAEGHGPGRCGCC